MKKSTLANLLTFAGAIPFIALLTLMVTPQASFLLKLNAQYYFLTYSAIILTFLGGIQWGLALRTDEAYVNTLLISSNVIALAAWTSITLVPAQFGLLIQAFFFSSILFIDRKLTGIGLIPTWFLKLRYQISLIVILTIVLMWWIF